MERLAKVAEPLSIRGLPMTLMPLSKSRQDLHKVLNGDKC